MSRRTVIVQQILDIEVVEAGDRPSGEFPETTAFFRDKLNGTTFSGWASGRLEVGDEVEAFVSGKDGNYIVGRDHFYGAAVAAGVLCCFIFSAGRVFGGDAAYFLWGGSPRLLERRHLAATLSLCVTLFLASAFASSWHWPYEYYIRYRAVSAVGNAVLALGTWTEWWPSKGVSTLCAIFAGIFALAHLSKASWHFINLASVLPVCLIGLAALHSLWPHRTEPTRTG